MCGRWRRRLARCCVPAALGCRPRCNRTGAYGLAAGGVGERCVVPLCRLPAPLSANKKPLGRLELVASSFERASASTAVVMVGGGGGGGWLVGGRHPNDTVGPISALFAACPPLSALQSATLPPAPPPRPLPPAACPDALADARRKPQICRAARNNRSIALNWPAHGSRYSSVSGSRFRFRNPSIAPTEPCLYT